MGYINFNPTAQQGFQNALGMGLQMGAQAREAKERREYRNALESYDPNNPESAKAIMKYDPRLGMHLSERAQAQQQAQQEAELTQRALAGDPDAIKQMATVNFDKYSKLDSQQKAAIKQEAEVYGNAAMDVLNLPPQQRPQAILAYAQRLGSEEIAQIANLPPQQQEAALRAAVAEAGMIKELQAMERPQYMAVEGTADLVNVRDPNAVAAVAARRAGQSIPPPPPGFVLDEGGTTGNSGGGF